MKKALLAVVAAAFIAAVALAHTMPIQITTVTTNNYQGTPTTTFKRGDVVIVETTLTCPTGYYYYAPAGVSYLGADHDVDQTR
jgi:hypothetical protein